MCILSAALSLGQRNLQQLEMIKVRMTICQSAENKELVSAPNGHPCHPPCPKEHCGDGIEVLLEMKGVCVLWGPFLVTWQGHCNHEYKAVVTVFIREGRKGGGGRERDKGAEGSTKYSWEDSGGLWKTTRKVGVGCVYSIPYRDWRAGSVVKGTGSSGRSPGFHSIMAAHKHTPGHLIAFSDLHRHKTNVRANTYT